MARSRRCGYCGAYGHNRRTCPHRDEADKAYDARINKRRANYREERYGKRETVRSCSYCAGTGHNTATCTVQKKDKATFKALHQEWFAFLEDQFLNKLNIGVGASITAETQSQYSSYCVPKHAVIVKGPRTEAFSIYDNSVRGTVKMYANPVVQHMAGIFDGITNYNTYGSEIWKTEAVRFFLDREGIQNESDQGTRTHAVEVKTRGNMEAMRELLQEIKANLSESFEADWKKLHENLKSYYTKPKAGYDIDCMAYWVAGKIREFTRVFGPNHAYESYGIARTSQGLRHVDDEYQKERLSCWFEKDGE